MNTRRSAAATPAIAVCLYNSDYEVSLERGKLYRVLPDPQARADGYFRVIDESGESYLFPEDWFQILPMSSPARRFIAAKIFGDKKLPASGRSRKAPRQVRTRAVQDTRRK